MNEERDDIQVQLDETQAIADSEETVELPQDDQQQAVGTDSGGEDELDKYTRGVSKRINKLNERIRSAEDRAVTAETKYAKLQNEYNTVKSRASVLDKSYTEEYENRVASQRQQAEDLYRKARDCLLYTSPSPRDRG